MEIVDQTFQLKAIPVFSQLTTFCNITDTNDLNSWNSDFERPV